MKKFMTKVLAGSLTIWAVAGIIFMLFGLVLPMRIWCGVVFIGFVGWFTYDLIKAIIHLLETGEWKFFEA